MTTKNKAAKAMANMRWAKMTPEQKKEATRKATEARWPKKKQKTPFILSTGKLKK